MVTVTLTGVAATASVGSVTVAEGAGALVTGASGTSAVGTVTVSEGGGASVEVTGVEATTPEAPGVLIWTVVDTSQTPNWTEIAA